MSREQSAKSKKFVTSQTTPLNIREEVPIKTSQSLNTESYEYFSQKITTRNNITESSVQESNQKTQTNQLKCTCNHDSSPQKNSKDLICICGKGMSSEEPKCICGLSEGISGSNLNQQIKIKTTTTTTKYNNVNINNNINASIVKDEQRVINEKNEISVNKESTICNCGQITNANISSQTNRKITMSKAQIEKSMKVKACWNMRCVGQNNENLQIIAAPKPELLIQCVQDINVIQEPRPVQILLPVVPNEIDYPLGLEIYGKEKKVLICPENVENLDVSKAYSTIKPHFENLDIGQSENIFCEKAPKKEDELNIQHEDLNIKKSKKDKYDMPLTLENGEMFVKGEKDFNKNNEIELTTKMNVEGKQKLTWNDTNEAIKTTKMNIDKNERTKFENLNVENNTYNFQGKPKNKYSLEETNKERNEEMEYPAEYTPTNWNESTVPMSGKPFTLSSESKKFDSISKSKGDKITIKKSYDTVDWNKKNNKRKEVQINMVKRPKKKIITKQKIQPVIIKGQENNWNNLIKQENDTNINIERTPKLNVFELSHGDEVNISNEAEEILINDDYNIVEENYARPIRANIKKVHDISEESVSSEYDVLKGIQKYMGQYQYKELVEESLKVQSQKIIINDISGKHPRRIETFHGLDENFEKFTNDKNKNDPRNFNVVINQVEVEKKVVHNKPVNEYHYEEKYEYHQEHRHKRGQEPDYEQSEPEDAQEMEQGHYPNQEQDMDVPEDKDHLPDKGVDYRMDDPNQGVEGEGEGEGEEENNEQEMEEQYHEGENEEPEQENENMEEPNEQNHPNINQNQEKNESEPRDEMEVGQHEEIPQNEEMKDTQPKEGEEAPKESKENSPKFYIKEITYTKNEENPEQNVANLRYITLKKKDEQEDSNSQPNDLNEENGKIKPQVEKEENKMNQEIAMESQKVEEQPMRKSENDSLSDLDKEIAKKQDNLEQEKKEENKENQDIAMESQKVEERPIGESGNDIKSDLNKEIEKKEETQQENKEEKKELTMDSQKVEEQQMNRGQGQPEGNELDEELKKKEEKNVSQKQEMQGQGEQHLEQQVGQQMEVHAEINNKEQIGGQQMEEYVEEYAEEHLEDNGEDQGEEHVEAYNEEQMEEHYEENIEDNNEEQMEEYYQENNEEQMEEHYEENNEEQMEEHYEEGEEEHFEQQEYGIEVQNGGQNIEHEQEIHEEEIQQQQEVKGNQIKKEVKKEGKTVSEIVAEAIQEEMQRQELNERELKQKVKVKEDNKYNSMVNAYTKHLKENPTDNYNRFATNKLNLIPKVTDIQSQSGQKLSRTIQTQIITQQKMEENTTTNPMTYSFGQGSVEGSHLSSGNKNAYYINSGFQGSGITFGQDSLTSAKYISGSNVNFDNKLVYNQQQISGQGMNGKYYFTKSYSSYSKTSKRNKEPMDTIKRKKVEKELKAGNEMDDIVFGPRDSKRK